MKEIVRRVLRRFPRVYGAARHAYALAACPALWRCDRRQARNEALRTARITEALPGPAFFVQVGSNDGVSGDPIHELVVSRGWRGLLVEPAPHIFRRLRANYAGREGLIFENVAVGDVEGMTPFYTVSDEAKSQPGCPPWFDQLGSFDRAHVAGHPGFAFAPYVVEQQVPCVPLPSLFRRHGIDHVDLLHIDAEGYDLRVLSQIDFTRLRPTVILFEHSHLSWADRGRAVRLLAGYRLFEERQDTLAIRA